MTQAMVSADDFDDLCHTSASQNHACMQLSSIDNIYITSNITYCCYII